MATGHRSSSNWVLILAHCKKILNPRIQPQGVSTGRQREQGGRPTKAKIYFRQKEGLAELHIRPPSPTNKALRGLPATHLPGGSRKGPKRVEEGEEGNAARRSHAASRAGRHHVVPAAEECREGGCALTPAHTHTLPDRARPHPPSAPSAAAAAARAERPQAARGPAARHGAAVTRPSGLARPLPPRRHTPLESLHAPLLASTFPLTGRPTLAIRLPHKAEGPQVRRGKAPEFNDLGFLFSHSPRNRPLEPSPTAILPPNTIYSENKLVNF